MMKNILLALFIFSSSLAFAQQDTTTVYASPGYAKDPMRANWKKNVVQKDSLWIVSLFNKKDILQEKISFADQKLEIRKGAYAFYENSNLKEEGNYDKGYKIGEWNSYFPNQQLSEKVNYSWGKLHGIYKSYWDNGQLRAKRNYAYGKKIGESKLFYKNGKLALHEIYNEKEKLIEGIYFDEEGKTRDKLSILEPPSYVGGMEAFYQFVSREIKYPTNAYKNRVEGTVKLEFTIMKNGTIDDVVAKESPDAALSREAMRVLNYTTNWLPAKELGEPVNLRYTVPIKFAIGH